jgi:transcriptional regulator with XRE-family HTH domain
MESALRAYRKSRRLTQQQCAKALELKSKGTISCLETGAWHASVELALKIEKWSEGRVPARTVVRPEQAHLLPEPPRTARA